LPIQPSITFLKRFIAAMDMSGFVARKSDTVRTEPTNHVIFSIKELVINTVGIQNCRWFYYAEETLIPDPDPIT
jgi:hypothetical protein